MNSAVKIDHSILHAALILLPRDPIHSGGGLAAAIEQTPANQYWANIQQMDVSKATKNKAVRDEYIARYRWLPLDFDPNRATDTAATEAEKALAYAVALKAWNYFRVLGVDPVVIDSGNGYYILVPIDLLNTDENKALINRVFAAAVKLFATDAVKLDTTSKNPSRILGIPGTINAKGTSTLERPHRPRLLRRKGSRAVLLSKEQLEAIAATVSHPSSVSTNEKGPFTFENVRGMFQALKDRNPEFDFKEATNGNGSTINMGRGWLVRCPNDEDHTEKIAGAINPLDSSAVVWVNERGMPDFKCQHNGNGKCGAIRWPGFVDRWGIKDLQSTITNPGIAYVGGGMALSSTFHYEQALADSFVEHHRNRVAFLDCGMWATYQGGLWVKDENDLTAARRVGKFLTEEILPLANGLGDEAPKGFKRQCGSAALQRNVVSLAKQRPQVFQRLDAFDRQQFLAGAPDGKVIDLVAGTIREAAPDDWLMKAVSVVPRSGECPRWNQFLNEITNNDHELKNYLQRMAGSWLTASARDQILAVFHGHGCNGKGTFVGVMQHILGAYAVTVPVDSLVTRKNGDEGDLTKLALLCGARLAVAQEGETTRRFNTGLLKTLTGDDELVGRRLFENPFRFRPTHKLVILTNNKPRIDIDGGIRRRLHLVPFTQSFEKVKNVNLKEELLEEAPEILYWMIEGCAMWHKDGLKAPSSVVDYTNEFFEDADNLKNWIEQNCVCAPDYWERTSDLYQDWVNFCQLARFPAGNQNDFLEWLQREGFKRSKNKEKTKRGVQGLKLKNNPYSHKRTAEELEQEEAIREAFC